MSRKTSSPRARLRFQISISTGAARAWKGLAKTERRNRSNMLEVLIEREAARLATMEDKA